MLLSGAEIWIVNKSEESKIIVFKNKILRNILELQTKAESGGSNIIEEIRDFC